MSAFDVLTERQGDRMKTYNNDELPRLRTATATKAQQQTDFRAASAPNTYTAKTLQVGYTIYLA